MALKLDKLEKLNNKLLEFFLLLLSYSKTYNKTDNKNIINYN